MKIILAIVSVVLFTFSVRGQDIHFSQYTQLPMLINPASTGMIEGSLRASLDYKSQWSAMGNPFRTMLATYDMPVLEGKKKFGHLGIGGYFYSDKAGDAHLGTSSANLCVSAIVPLNDKSKLSAGFQFGYNHRSANISNLQWPSQYNGQNYDPGITANQEHLFTSFNYFDMSSGIHYQFLKTNGNTQGKDILKINMGVSYFHFTRPDQNFYSIGSDPLYGKIIFNALVRYDIPETKIGIIPSGIFMSQGPATEMNFGISLRYKLSEGTKITGFKTESAISGGIAYRINDAFIPQILLEYANFGLGISYDLNTSSLSQATHAAGGLEILLKYSLVNDGLSKTSKKGK